MKTVATYQHTEVVQDKQRYIAQWRQTRDVINVWKSEREAQDNAQYYDTIARYVLDNMGKPIWGRRTIT